MLDWWFQFTYIEQFTKHLEEDHGSRMTSFDHRDDGYAEIMYFQEEVVINNKKNKKFEDIDKDLFRRGQYWNQKAMDQWKFNQLYSSCTKTKKKKEGHRCELQHRRDSQENEAWKSWKYGLITWKARLKWKFIHRKLYWNQ